MIDVLLVAVSVQYTPVVYNKTPVKIDQGLDFLKIWRGKSKKTIGKTRENEEKAINK